MSIEEWPNGGLERVDECPICGSEERKLVYSSMRDWLYGAPSDLWRFVECRECNCLYLDPRPTQATLHVAYKNYHTHNPVRRIEFQELRGLAKLRRMLANGYRNRRFGGSVQPELRLGAIIVRLSPRLRARLDRRLYHLPKLWHGARLLDVGCGSGNFLLDADEIGWSVVGVDPDPEATKRASELGLRVWRGDIGDLPQEEGQFDVVSLSHVIEHVHKPSKLIANAFERIRPGGYIFIDTPNKDAFGHHVYGRDWRGLETPRHLVLMNWELVEEMLKTTGFHRLTRKVRGDNYRALATESKIIRQRRNPNASYCVALREWSLDRLANLMITLDHKKSEFVTIIAQKPSEQI